MFEKFTERARKVLNIARAEAQRLNSEFIGTEHILLGISQEGGGVAAKVLKNRSVDYERVQKELVRLLQPNPTPTVSLGHLPFSPRAKRALELAHESSKHLGHDVIGTEHLLLGILKENEGIAAMVLQNLGVRLNEVHDTVLELFGTDAPPRPAAPPVEPLISRPPDEDILSKVKRIFMGNKMPPTPPMLDKIGDLRATFEGLDAIAQNLIHLFKQLEAETTNAAARAELDDLRTRILEMIEAWRGRISG